MNENGFSQIENINFILEGIKKGAYNLYLGAGASHKCKNQYNKDFPLGEELKKIISERYSKSARSLFQLATLITEKELNDILQEQFNTNTSNLSLAIKSLPKYVWKRVFTLNVDNSIEKSYLSENAKQELISNNFKDTFYMESELQKLQIIHLHGFIEKPEDGYIFNAKEYIQNIKGNNTWMTVFSDLFKSECFIMSGLSFNEEDVDYYLSYRSNFTQKPDLYPSILIEPFPDDYTIEMCKTHGLKLVQATFDEFMQFLNNKLPRVPSVYDLVNIEEDVLGKVDEREKFLFFSEFEMIKNTSYKTSGMSSFDYGFEPEMKDILSNKDIHREITDTIVNRIIGRKKRKCGDLIFLSGKYLNGKTTTALRVLSYFTNQDFYVFRLKSLRGFSVDNTIKCIKSLNKDCLIYIDNLAEYIHQVNDIIMKCPSVVILGTEREYRIEHIKKILVDFVQVYNCDNVSFEETKMLVQKYLSLGHVRNTKLFQNNDILYKHTIGEQVCLILDSYDPIQKKIPDFFKTDEQKKDLEALLLIAICCYCYKLGVNYFLIRSILPKSYNFNALFKTNSQFKLEFNQDDRDYVLPRNKLYFRQLIEYYLKTDRTMVEKCYIQIVKKISPFVNRKTIMMHTPESKLLARMLDVDKNVKHFFLEDIQKFMEDIKPVCEWNSRYWEQWALSLIKTDIDTAVSYAKTAVTLENHPYPLTTLGKILFQKMNQSSLSEKPIYCTNALSECLFAMKEESKRRMESIHPVLTIITGLNLYMKTFPENENLPSDLCRNVYSALDTYEQDISLSKTEKESLAKIKEYLL